MVTRDLHRRGIKTVSLAVNTIGQGLALARGLVTKHAIKQVDRLLSNQGIDIDAALRHWVPYVVGSRACINVAMDWTDFDADGQATIMLSLLTRHGRATPLLWLTVGMVMSDLVVIEFSSEAKAEEVRQKLLDMQNEYLIGHRRPGGHPPGPPWPPQSDQPPLAQSCWPIAERQRCVLRIPIVSGSSMEDLENGLSRGVAIMSQPTGKLAGISGHGALSLCMSAARALHVFAPISFAKAATICSRRKSDLLPASVKLSWSIGKSPGSSAPCLRLKIKLSNSAVSRARNPDV